MLRFGLVLLLATSAIAAPGYANSFDYMNVIANENAGVAKNIGAVNHLTDKMFSYLDGADANLNILTMHELINEMGSKHDSYSQALSLSQAIASTLTQATGIPGDTCVAASLNDAFPTGHYRQALINYINHIANNLNLLSKVSSSPESVRFASGPISNCPGSGRVYNLEGSWKAILGSASAANTVLLNEQYCTAKRLYCAFNARTNNVGAVVTASSLPPVVRVFQHCLPSVINYLNAVAANRNVNSTLGQARQALSQAVLRV